MNKSKKRITRLVFALLDEITHFVDECPVARILSLHQHAVRFLHGDDMVVFVEDFWSHRRKCNTTRHCGIF